ncbi:hypothetical protein K1T71_006454 [Dendrolimus kikuchii]|uniref:Uncharacterized protein n=1 Tax=Dendrolimus kikuchii TaxID=765133 RepID=A0ACC1D147_9NEOP|nr:hypothetical protein K1T71_006454 [Dendrolimus kikuchii]
MGDQSKRQETPTPFEEALDQTGNGLYNVLLVMTSALILLAIGVDLFGFSLVVAAACDLNLTVTEKGILTSLPFVGILLVSYIWGYVSDKRGRRFALVVPLQISLLMSCIASLSPHWLVLGLAKFFCVCFSCAANSATYTLVGESCIQRVRSKYMLLMTCLLLLSPAAAGVLTYPTLKLNFAAEVPWLGIVFRPWRLLIIVLGLPSGVGAALMYFFYESPKFLFNCGRKEEALDALKGIYAINHWSSKNNYQVTSLTLEDEPPKKHMSLLKAMFEQAAPLFRRPYLWRSLQLFYIVAVVYITNNSFLVWLPYIMNIVRITFEKETAPSGGICALVTNKPDVTVTSNTTAKINTQEICLGTIEDNVILTLIASQATFAFLNFALSYLPHRRKAVLMAVLLMSSLSGSAINLVPNPIASVFFFMVFTGTCLGMGILASYFVDLYPTTYRGMVTCLSVMVGRSSTFFGINIVGNLIFNHCQVTFYMWSLLVLSSVVAAWFLPPDKPQTPKQGSP